MTGTFMAQGLLAFGSDNHHRHILRMGLPNRQTEAFCRLSETIRQPAFGSTVNGAGVDTNDKRGLVYPAPSQSPSHRIFFCLRDEQFRRGRIIVKSQRLQQIPIVENLMKVEAFVWHYDGLRQQDTPAIGGIPISTGNSGQPYEHRRFEGILEEDRQIKPLSTQLSG